MTAITRTLSLIVLVGTIGTHTLSAQTGYDPRRTISVSGEADVKVVPDEGSISLGINVSDRDASSARSESDRRFRELVAALKKAGIAERDIRSVGTSIGPRYDYVEGKQIFREYVAERTVVVTVRDIAKFEDILIAALDAGGTNVGDLELRTTKLRQFRDQARQNALKAAREKATAMAGELGMRLLKPISISETDSYDYPRPMAQNAMTRDGDGGGGEGSGGLSAGEITVKARVSVVFEME